MSTFVILLRAIGPITHKIMSMAQWREAVAAAGYDDPQTYVATGNMIVGSGKGIAEVTAEMNAVVRDLGLGKGNVAVVRKAGALRKLVKANPFPDAAAERASELAVYFFAGAKPDFSWLAGYDGPERVHVEGTHLFVDYAGRASLSPRLPGLIEKRSGTVTARNWNTVKALAERAAGRG
ncbi:hypothetical protein ASD04_18765 [Devosia sp. Root436]|jgi:uncharacterized protein (DUF1697 family)|uniref:DUF1697 domain-containing protein n=1 Tax=Devosia sp. Root436 TaxID=1736537 RepID=UPI0006F3A4FD|nr:DUF1697 domain-containing protein [Devosia sp. Root436]KQX40812.1 hypothetical protein ASD04_18765 [Devosia sp. Root436]